MKKIISLLLAVIMVVSLFPVMAFAYAPESNPTAPTVPGNQVKAIYSAVYMADCNFADGGSGTTYAQEDYGKKFTTTDSGYFNLTDFALDCSKMEKLHMDVWFTEAGTFRVVTIHGGAEKGVTVTVGEGEKNSWKSVEIALNEGDWAQVTDWSNVSQLKIDNVKNKTFWVNNIYFYTSKASYAITNGTKVDDKETNHGYITVDETAAKDATVTVTVTPSEGYALKTLTVSKTGDSATTVSAAKQADGTYKFTMPAYAVTITATFAEPITGITSWSALQNAIDEATGMTTIKLTQDLTAPDDASSITIPAVKDITLDLNGYVLDRHLTSEKNSGNVIIVNGNLTVRDGSANTPHAGYVDANGLWHLAEEGHPTSGETAVTIKGGIITGGSSSSNGGCITVNNSGNMVILGGTLCGNKTSGGGGCIYTSDTNPKTTLTLNGGRICYNISTNNNGGAVCINGVFNMLSGKIDHNIAKGNGGGVRITGNGSFNMYGGEISYNKASNGGGLNSDGPVVLGNSAIINDNTNASGNANNVYLPNSKTITLGTEENAPKNGMNIGITTQTPPAAGTAKQFTTNGTVDDLKYFFSDNTAYYVNFNTDHLELKAPAEGNKALNVIQSEHGTVTASEQEATEGNPITLTIAPDEGYQLKTLKYNDGTTDYDITKDATTGEYQFTMPAKAVTITAEFELIPEKEPEEPKPERKSYTTVTIGGNKKETKAEETVEENPDTGAPVMSFGAVAVVLGAAYVISKKH